MKLDARLPAERCRFGALLITSKYVSDGPEESKTVSRAQLDSTLSSKALDTNTLILEAHPTSHLHISLAGAALAKSRTHRPHRCPERSG